MVWMLALIQAWTGFGNDIALSSDKTDTLQLQTVEVFAPALDKYALGQKVLALKAEDLEDFQGDALTEFLQRRTGLFLRQSGPGMLASLTIRGTSAGHQAVFWNGLPINSPSLGQMDFSILPLGGMDELSIHFGSAGALYGTDAIGGAIHLNNKLHFGTGHQFQSSSVIGSFGKWNQKLSYGYATGNWASRTQVYQNIATNDFPYRNLSKIGTPTERMPNSEVLQQGFVQDLAWKIAQNHQLSSSLWFNFTDRNIPPIIGSQGKDQQQDRNLRWVLDYFHWGKNTLWNSKAGIVRDELVFNVAAKNLTAQYFFSQDVDWTISEKWTSKTGIRFTFIDGNLDTYEAQENRWELYESLNFTPSGALAFSLNLRQLVYDGNFAPFTPSLGARITLWEHRAQSLKFLANGARSFKVPTLNDRFWNPGGRPDLKPESSWSGELGLSHTWKGKLAKISQELTHYRMWVDNWIIWLPQGNLWSPQNIRKVHNSGLEYRLEAEMRSQDWTFTAQGNYALTRALNQTNISENDRSRGKQLPYTPEHKVQGYFNAEKGPWSTWVNWHWVSERQVTTDHGSGLPAYQLLDWGINRRFNLGKNLKMRGGFQINNVLDTEYHIMRLRPMPGRNYQLQLHIAL